jgi:hypothetical protein
MRSRPRTAAILLLTASLLAQAQDEPAPAAFAWRGSVDTTGRSGLVRAAVPAEALARLQSRDAADLRVFDASGRPVPFAFARPPRPPGEDRPHTAAFPALPLYAAQPGRAAPKGAVQLKVEEGGGNRTLWVQLGQDGPQPAPAGARPLPAALFDTRAQKEPVTGFVLRARIPTNVPVPFTLATSPDLASWTPVAVQGRIFRFEGEGAPANDRLELGAPLALQDRYLRVDWSGQEGVALDAVVGLLAAPQPEPAYPSITLPAPVADGPAALEWQLGFATPIARLELATPRDNTLVPLRLLGRNQASEPWRPLASTLVYRLGAPGQQAVNTPVALPVASVRWLRAEATHGARLESIALTVRAQFEPLEVVFPAGDGGPYTLAAGRPATPQAALPLGMLASTTATPIAALPLVTVGAAQSSPAPAPGWWSPWLPRHVDGKTASLWLVLALGVLLLGGVAWALLRQLNAKRDTG